MICASNGEVSFEDGLCIQAHAHVAMLSGCVCSRRDLPVPGWRQYVFGIHPSEHGDFKVEASVSKDYRVEALFLCHYHSFYQPDTPEDAERRVYHESVIATDLRGQREFPWGQVFCRLDKQANRDWLAIVYNPFANVPLRARSEELLLFAREPVFEGDSYSDSK